MRNLIIILLLALALTLKIHDVAAPKYLKTIKLTNKNLLNVKYTCKF